MGGMTYGTGGASGGFNPRDKVIKESKYHKKMTEEYVWWSNKRNEILGQMMQDKDFARYVFAYKDAESPHIDIDKEYLEKAVLFIDALEDEMDDQFLMGEI